MSPTTTIEHLTSDLPQPLVIPRSEHPISRKYIDREALKVLYRLRDAGFTAYLVGGGVRDIYLGKTPKDFDISTDARPGEVRKLFRNSRVIGRRFRLVQVFYGGGKIVEVSTFRRRNEFEPTGGDAVLAANNTYGNPAEDAFRRDLTINALFYEIENFTVIDYVGGVQDLEDGIVRIVGEPERRIVRDPVRMMRVIRHAARAGFTIEAATWAAICANCHTLTQCPSSRVRDELFKDLKGGASKAWATLALDCGLFFVIFPFYRAVLLNQPAAAANRHRLLGLLGVVDRLLASSYSVPEPLLVAMFLLPWAQAEMALFEVASQKESYLLSRKIHDAMADSFSFLNFSRSMQDTTARCLATLPLLVQHENERSWPKWLQKKSYFETGLQLFRMYREANGGPLVDSLPLVIPKEIAPRLKPRKPAPRGGSRAPALAQGIKGGIFGFRKK